jgi:nicotinamidase-related amidase
MKPALLVIDPQRVYTDKNSELYCQSSSTVIKKINQLIAYFQAQNIAVIFIRHVHKNDGSDLGRMFDFSGEFDGEFNFKEGSAEAQYDPRLLFPAEKVDIVKTRYSAFKNTDLNNLLKRMNIDTVVICGFMTNFCCDSTAREAHDLDYFVDFIVDATGTPGTDKMDEKQVRIAVGEFLASGFARVLSTNKYIKSEH